MDDDRRRFNNEENDSYTNNSRRTPVVPPRGYAPQGGRPAYGQGYNAGDRGYDPASRGYVPQGGNYGGRSLPAASQNGSYGGRTIPSAPQGANPAQGRPYQPSGSPSQGGYSGYDNGQRAPYRPAQPPVYGQSETPRYAQPQAPAYGQQGAPQGYPQQNGYQPQGYNGYPQQNGYQPQPAYGTPQDGAYNYENVQAQPAEKKKRGFFGFGKQKKEEIDPNNIGNVIITEPRTFDDVRVIIDGLRKRQAIIIDLSKVNDKDSQRTLDILSGAIYALGGAQQRINDHMFLFTPEGVMIQGPASLRNKYK